MSRADLGNGELRRHCRVMEIEFHRLDLRYEGLRGRSPKREKRLLASLAANGQQMPIVVVGGGEDCRWVVVDGYKRVRALKKLKADIIEATRWELKEIDALVLERLMRCTDGNGAIEQAWLLRELQIRFELSHEELARRFDKSESWVSRRLGLIGDLPEEIQIKVREGAIVAHAAMKYLIPMARANVIDALRLVSGIYEHRPSSRQIGELYVAWLGGDWKSREQLLSDPWLFLRAREEVRRSNKSEKSPAEQLIGEFGALGGISRRVTRGLKEGLAQKLLAEQCKEICRCMLQAKADIDVLFDIGQKELINAR